MNVLRKFTFGAISKSLRRTSKNSVFSQMVIHKLYHDDKNKDINSDEPRGDMPSAMTSKYQVFRDEDATVILDVDEERKKYLGALEEPREKKTDDEFYGLNLERGIHGVYDIEDLVELLRREKMQDIFVATIPPNLKYVDYIVVVTGKSMRHMTSVAEFVRKIYKRKRNSSDIIPRIEGESSKDWMALDLGNIALHIFSKNARTIYDLESLWSLGSQFDLSCNKAEDPVIALLQKHSIYIGDLQPAERAG